MANSRVLRSERLRRRACLEARGRAPTVSFVRKSCSQLFFLFGDLAAYLGKNGSIATMQPMQFLRDSGLFQRNITWLRDPYLENFTNGVSEEISSAQELVEWMRDYRASLSHVTSTYTVGTSSGCYGALHFGHHFNVDAVFGFSPQTAQTDVEESRLRLRDLLANHNGNTRYHIFFAPKNRLDRRFAELLAPCPGVTLHPCPEYGRSHYVMRHMACDDVLKTVIPPFERSNLETSP